MHVCVFVCVYVFVLISLTIQGMCYIETAGLDGETNLKIRQVECGENARCVCVIVSQALDETCQWNEEGTLEQQLKGVEIECEPPNKRLYR
jgi:hypothetical protein